MIGESAERFERESHPSAVDIHVGSRIRLRRTMLGMSQERLANALGLTFQQVQKYERGTNRVGASRLFDISRIMNIPIAYFFDDMPSHISAGPPSGPRGRNHGFSESPSPFGDDIDEQLSSRETRDLIQAYYRIADPAVRVKMLELIKSLATSKTKSDTNL